MDSGYPMVLDLQGARCVVVGGGRVAARKITSLLESGANVHVISPKIDKTILNWSRDGLLTVHQRDYAGACDLDNARLVFAATDSADVNGAVCRDASAREIPVNDAIAPERGTFIVPSVMRRGKLVMTASTSGASPGLSAMLRRELEERYGDEYEEYVDFLSELREQAQRIVNDPEKRTAIFQNALKFDILRVIREGRFAQYRRQLLLRLERLDAALEWENLLERRSVNEKTCSGGQSAKRAGAHADESGH